jgi:hypothetical protein
VRWLSGRLQCHRPRNENDVVTLDFKWLPGVALSGQASGRG